MTRLIASEKPVSPREMKEILRLIPGQPRPETLSYRSSRGGDGCYYLSRLEGKVWTWNDFDPANAQVVVHDSLEAAVQSIIEGCAALYEEYHEMEDHCDVTCTYEDDCVVGFRLSRDDDGQQRGDDERFTATPMEF